MNKNELFESIKKFEKIIGGLESELYRKSYDDYMKWRESEDRKILRKQISSIKISMKKAELENIYDDVREKYLIIIKLNNK